MTICKMVEPKEDKGFNMHTETISSITGFWTRSLIRRPKNLNLPYDVHVTILTITTSICSFTFTLVFIYTKHSSSPKKKQHIKEQKKHTSRITRSKLEDQNFTVKLCSGCLTYRCLGAGFCFKQRSPWRVVKLTSAREIQRNPPGKKLGVFVLENQNVCFFRNIALNWVGLHVFGGAFFAESTKTLRVSSGKRTWLTGNFPIEHWGVLLRVDWLHTGGYEHSVFGWMWLYLWTIWMCSNPEKVPILITVDQYQSTNQHQNSHHTQNPSKSR